MKKTFFVLGIVALLATGLFAEGVREDPFVENREELQLTGSLQFVDGYPLLRVNGKDWAIIAPGLMRQARTVREGLEISLEGYKVQPGPRAIRPELDHILADKITVDGKTYDLSQNRSFHRGGRQPHHQGGPWDNRGNQGRPGYGRPGDQGWGPQGSYDRSRRPGPTGRNR